MTMAHGLKARLPFLDVEFTRLALSMDPARKMVDRDTVVSNAGGREKTYLRELYRGPNADGNSILELILLVAIHLKRCPMTSASFYSMARS